jgi:hypothetical protein
MKKEQITPILFLLFILVIIPFSNAYKTCSERGLSSCSVYSNEIGKRKCVGSYIKTCMYATNEIAPCWETVYNCAMAGGMSCIINPTTGNAECTKSSPPSPTPTPPSPTPPCDPNDPKNKIIKDCKIYVCGKETGNAPENSGCTLSSGKNGICCSGQCRTSESVNDCGICNRKCQLGQQCLKDKSGSYSCDCDNTFCLQNQKCCYNEDEPRFISCVAIDTKERCGECYKQCKGNSKCVKNILDEFGCSCNDDSDCGPARLGAMCCSTPSGEKVCVFAEKDHCGDCNTLSSTKCDSTTNPPQVCCSGNSFISPFCASPNDEDHCGSGCKTCKDGELCIAPKGDNIFGCYSNPSPASIQFQSNTNLIKSALSFISPGISSNAAPASAKGLIRLSPQETEDEKTITKIWRLIKNYKIFNFI